MWKVNDENEVYRSEKTYASKRGYFLVIYDRYDTREEAEEVAEAINEAVYDLR